MSKFTSEDDIEQAILKNVDWWKIIMIELEKMRRAKFNWVSCFKCESIIR